MKKRKPLIFITVLLMCSAFTLQATILRQHTMGAKAAAMGGAFVALADDYSAIYWNPAGLCQIPMKQTFLSAAPIFQTGDYAYPGAGVPGAETSMLHFAGTMGYVKPLSAKSVFAVSISETPLVGAKWDAADFKDMLGTDKAKLSSFAADFSITPAYAYKLSRHVQIGVALNMHYTRWNLDKPSLLGQYGESLKGMGVGATAGILIHSGRGEYTIGLTFKTPVKIKLKGDAQLDMTYESMGMNSGLERNVSLPMWVGFGMAFKTYKRLWATFDVQYTKWSDFHKVRGQYDEPIWNEILDDEMMLTWTERTVIRVGLQYKVSDTFTLRAGYYVDRAPAENRPLNIFLPSDDMNWITAGFGYYGKHMTIELGVELALKKQQDLGTRIPNFTNRTEDKLGLVTDESEVLEAYAGTLGMMSVIPTFSLTYRF